MTGHIWGVVQSQGMPGMERIFCWSDLNSWPIALWRVLYFVWFSETLGHFGIYIYYQYIINILSIYYQYIYIYIIIQLYIRNIYGIPSQLLAGFIASVARSLQTTGQVDRITESQAVPRTCSMYWMYETYMYIISMDWFKGKFTGKPHV